MNTEENINELGKSDDRSKPSLNYTISSEVSNSLDLFTSKGAKNESFKNNEVHEIVENSKFDSPSLDNSNSYKFQNFNVAKVVDLNPENLQKKIKNENDIDFSAPDYNNSYKLKYQNNLDKIEERKNPESERATSDLHFMNSDIKNPYNENFDNMQVNEVSNDQEDHIPFKKAKIKNEEDSDYFSDPTKEDDEMKKNFKRLIVDKKQSEEIQIKKSDPQIILNSYSDEIQNTMIIKKDFPGQKDDFKRLIVDKKQSEEIQIKKSDPKIILNSYSNEIQNTMIIKKDFPVEKDEMTIVLKKGSNQKEKINFSNKKSSSSSDEEINKKEEATMTMLMKKKEGKENKYDELRLKDADEPLPFDKNGNLTSSSLSKSKSNGKIFEKNNEKTKKEFEYSSSNYDSDANDKKKIETNFNQNSNPVSPHQNTKKIDKDVKNNKKDYESSSSSSSSEDEKEKDKISKNLGLAPFSNSPESAEKTKVLHKNLIQEKKKSSSESSGSNFFSEGKIIVNKFENILAPAPAPSTIPPEKPNNSYKTGKIKNEDADSSSSSSITQKIETKMLKENTSSSSSDSDKGKKPQQPVQKEKHSTSSYSSDDDRKDKEAKLEVKKTDLPVKKHSSSSSSDSDKGKKPQQPVQKEKHSTSSYSSDDDRKNKEAKLKVKKTDLPVKKHSSSSSSDSDKGKKPQQPVQKEKHSTSSYSSDDDRKDKEAKLEVKKTDLPVKKHSSSSSLDSDKNKKPQQPVKKDKHSTDDNRKEKEAKLEVKKTDLPVKKHSSSSSSYSDKNKKPQQPVKKDKHSTDDNRKDKKAKLEVKKTDLSTNNMSTIEENSKPNGKKDNLSSFSFSDGQKTKIKQKPRISSSSSEINLEKKQGLGDKKEKIVKQNSGKKVKHDSSWKSSSSSNEKKREKIQKNENNRLSSSSDNEKKNFKTDENDEGLQKSFSSKKQNKNDENTYISQKIEKPKKVLKPNNDRILNVKKEKNEDNLDSSDSNMEIGNKKNNSQKTNEKNDSEFNLEEIASKIDTSLISNHERSEKIYEHYLNTDKKSNKKELNKSDSDLEFQSLQNKFNDELMDRISKSRVSELDLHSNMINAIKFENIYFFDFSNIGLNILEPLINPIVAVIKIEKSPSAKKISIPRSTPKQTPRPSEILSQKSGSRPSEILRQKSGYKNDMSNEKSSVLSKKINFSHNKEEKKEEMERESSTIFKTLEKKYLKLKNDNDKDFVKNKLLKEKIFSVNRISNKFKIKEQFQHIIIVEKDNDSFFSSFGISVILSEIQKMMKNKKPQILNDLIKRLEATYNKEMENYDEEVPFFSKIDNSVSPIKFPQLKIENNSKIQKFLSNNSSILVTLLYNLKNIISIITNDSSLNIFDLFIDILNEESLFSLSIIVLFRVLAYNGIKQINENNKLLKKNLTVINGELKNVMNIFEFLTNETYSKIHIWLYENNEFSETQHSQIRDNKKTVDVHLFYDGEKYISLYEN